MTVPTVRPPAVAGVFYPADADELRQMIRYSFAGAVESEPTELPPQALVVPHAGFVYSGPIAASAYRLLEPHRATIRTVVLLGPSHRVPLRGVGLTSADAWRTPLGDVEIDHSRDTALLRMPFVEVNDMAHAPEHSLEVQLPFLQTVLDDFRLVPLVVGFADPDEVDAVIEMLWTGPDTLIVVSTDLSHYHEYHHAQAVDAHTAAAILSCRFDDIDDEDACGARPLRGLLRAATERRLEIEQLDLRNSGDTAGDRHRVVGYGAFRLT